MDHEPVIDYDVFDAPLPRYAGQAIVVIAGQPIDLNALEDPFAAERSRSSSACI